MDYNNRLYDSDFVGNIESIIVGSQSDISFLVSLGSDQGVDLGHVDVVEFLHGQLDLRFRGSHIGDKDESVVVLNLLHGTLSGERVMDDRELVHASNLRGRLPRVQTTSWKGQGLRATEMH